MGRLTRDRSPSPGQRAFKEDISASPRSQRSLALTGDIERVEKAQYRHTKVTTNIHKLFGSFINQYLQSPVVALRCNLGRSNRLPQPVCNTGLDSKYTRVG